MIEKTCNGDQAPLAGMRVLDLGTMIAGPIVATLLADFGAEVIKVEQPRGGDTLRSIGPGVEGEGLWWQVESRNKRSITIDLRQEDGQALVRRLSAHADVVVENFRPGTMQKWNLAYEDLSAANQRLVLVSVSGFGQTGPYAPRPAYDRIALAFSGLLNMTGYPDRPPLRPGNAMADYQAGILGAFGAMVALHNRDHHTGRGEHVDLSLFETVFRFTDVMLTAYEKLGLDRQRNGNRHFAAAPGDHFEMKNGKFIVLTISNEQMFRRLARAMNREELTRDPRFETHSQRWAHIDEINGIVGEWILTKEPEEVLSALERGGLAYSIIYEPEDILGDPHFNARQSFVTMAHPRIGDLKVQAVHPRFAAWQPDALRHAPDLGADTDAVLGELLGMQSSEVERLRARGII